MIRIALVMGGFIIITALAPVPVAIVCAVDFAGYLVYRRAWRAAKPPEKFTPFCPKCHAYMVGGMCPRCKR